MRKALTRLNSSLRELLERWKAREPNSPFRRAMMPVLYYCVILFTVALLFSSIYPIAAVLEYLFQLPGYSAVYLGFCGMAWLFCGIPAVLIFLAGLYDYRREKSRASVLTQGNDIIDKKDDDSSREENG